MSKLKIVERVGGGPLTPNSGPPVAPDVAAPPNTLDGAKVLHFAWSGRQPYFEMLDTEGRVAACIHGLAVCRYGEAGKVYRFSCDENWEVVNDMGFASVDDALSAPSAHYDMAAVWWQSANPGPATT